MGVWLSVLRDTKAQVDAQARAWGSARSAELSQGPVDRPSSGLFSCVSFEVFGQYGPNTFTAADELFERQLQVLADTTGLP